MKPSTEDLYRWAIALSTDSIEPQEVERIAGLINPFKPGVQVRALTESFDNDPDTGLKRHVKVGDVGTVNTLDGERVHVAFPNGAWLIYDFDDIDEIEIVEPPEPVESWYTFDVKLFATARVKATSEKDAREEIDDTIADMNLFDGDGANGNILNVYNLNPDGTHSLIDVKPA